MIRVLSFLCCAILFVSLAPVSKAVLLAHYEFESNGSLGLDSAGSHDGIQAGGDVVYSNTSRLGTGALRLDGTGTGIRLDNSADFQSLTTFTIAAFVRPDLNSATWGGGANNVGRIFGSVGLDGPGGTPYGDVNGYGFALLRSGNTAGLRYTSYLVKDYDLTAGSLATPIQDDEWVHAAVVVTEGNAEFFLDGASVGLIEHTLNANVTSNFFHIGASGNSNTDAFAGLLDDVRIYNEALDSTAISTLANPGGTGQLGLYVEVDRETGDIMLVNDSSSSVDIRGYSLLSDTGRFESESWLSVTDNYDQGNGSATLDSDDDWLLFSTSAFDLSEATQGELSLGGGSTIALGNAWRKGPAEDVTAEILLSDGTSFMIPVEFTGNGDTSWLTGDLDFDGDIDLADFSVFNAGLFSTDLDAELTDTYLMGDLDGDGDNDFFDFLLFKESYVAAGGNPAAVSFGSAVPEPSSMALLSLAAVGCLVSVRRRLGRAALAVVASLGACLAACGPAVADFTPVFEYSFPASYDGTGPGSSVLDQSSAGHDATVDAGTNTAALIDNRPSGFDSSLMSLTAANGGHGATTEIDLLENSTIDDYGGFMMDVWMQWEGTYTNTRKQIDYAGTEYIRTSGGDAVAGTTPVQFVLSDSGTILSHTINANEWYHVQGVFDSGTNQTDESGNLVGNAYLYVDGVLVDSAFGVTKTSFGDSLDRPIGINRWAGGGGDWNQGLIFNPSVYLGHAEEPMQLFIDTTTGEATLEHMPNGLLPDARDIDFYQITSASGALTTDTWTSLQDSGFGGEANAADYNSDGFVDIADYTVWRNLLGSTGSDLAADGNGDSVVDAADYVLWKDNFGASPAAGGWAEAGVLTSSLIGESYLTGSTLFANGLSTSLGELWDETSLLDPTTDLVFQYHVAGESGLRTGVVKLVGGTLVASVAVPEPSSVLLLGLAGIGLLAVRRRQVMGTTAPRKWAAALLSVVALFTCQSASADTTNDRVYPFGESAGDGGSAGVYVIDSAYESTFDDAYDSNNLSGTAHDLLPFEYDGTAALKASSGTGPQFTSVAGRPLAGSSTIGVTFDGVNDMLIGARLGMPQTSASSLTGSTTPPTALSAGTGPFDYSGITRRGFDLWVNPDETNAVFGTSQQAVVLDTNQHGVLISDAGTWVLRYDATDIDSGVAVKDNSVDGGWSHVMVVNPNGLSFSGGILYVDGEAIAARRWGYTPSDDTPLVIGASTGVYDPNADESLPVFQGGTSDFFAGSVDNLNMFVLGKSLGGVDYGTFNLVTDNPYVANALSGYGEADLNGDGLTTETDVTAFIANWGSINLVNDLQIGDLSTRMAGDFNIDGAVGLDDWQILAENYTGSAPLNLDALLAGQAIPEPSSIVLLAMAAGLLMARKQRR